MNIVTQIFGNIASSENSLKDILAILVSSITIIVAIYYALNFFLNMDKEEKVMNIYGYNRKSIDVPFVLFIIIYSIFPIFGIILYKLDNFLLESAIIFTYITIVMLCISLPILNMGMIMGISIGILIPFTLINIIGIAIDISTDINININISRNIIFLIFIISIIISILIGRYIFFNKSSNNSYSSISLFISSIIGSCLFCNLIIYFQLHFPSQEYLKKITFLLFLLYPFLGLGIFHFNDTKYKKTELKKIEITLKKDIPESTTCEDKIGFIISETNDDIVFEIDGILHRYRKSDIYCIKEYQNPYASILETIDNHLTHIKNNLIIISIYKFIYYIDRDKNIYGELKSNYESIKYNILNLNKMNDHHYDSIINTMKEDILKLKESLSKIEKNKTTEYHTNIKNYLSAINNRINKISEKKQELELEKKKLEDKNQKPPTI